MSELKVSGTLHKVLTPQTGTGSKGNWIKQEFVIETTEDQYPKKVCLSLWGDKVEKLNKFNPGDKIQVSFNVESREHNDKWYTELRAWKLSVPGKTEEKEEKSDKDFSVIITDGQDDDLPF